MLAESWRVGAVLQGAPPPEQVRQQAHEILQRSEFGRHESLLERIFGWLGDLLSRISFGVGGGPGFVGDLVSLLLLGAVVVMLVVVVRVLLTRSRLPKEAAAPGLVVDVEEGRDAADWGREAERFEAQGQWREAMRARYRELIRALIEDGVLDDVPGRTTGEYRVAFDRARPGAARPFDELTSRFEAVWYGGVEIDDARYREFRDLAANARQRQPVGV